MPSPAARIAYRIDLNDPHAHLIDVILTVSDPDPTGERLTLPTWIPGSYLIREFARNIVAIEASAGAGKQARPVTLTKLDKCTWQAGPTDGPLTVRYRVYAYDLSVRGAYFDTTRAFWNATSTCLAVVGREQEPVAVEIVPPRGKGYADWRVATTLPRAKGTDRWSFGHYTAANYDELIDHPVECAVFDLVSFKAHGTPHHIVVTGRHFGNLERLAADVQKICENQIALFASPPKAPFKEYLFQLAVVGDGYGGLEHRSSTALIASRDDLPAADEPAEPSPGYRQLLGLFSHEYFHSWNVKRLKPAAYAPYDLSREAYSRLLWAFEGITSYYDDLALVRSGVISEATYLEVVAQNLTSVLRSPGCRVQNLEDASFDAWIKYYRQDENSPNALASYYVKGALVALLLDLTLRREGRSLDDVMRALWKRYGANFDRTGEGLPEGEWERTAQDVAGMDLSAFFDLHLRTPSDLAQPLMDAFKSVGVTLQLRCPSSASDKGGKLLDKAPEPRNTLGARTASDALGAKLSAVLNGGAAEEAGLAGGDVLIALDGLRVTNGNLDGLLSRLPLAAKVTAHAFRRDELKTVTLKLQATRADTAGLAVDTNGKAKAVVRRNAWLRG